MGRMILGVIVGYATVTFFVVMELELLYFVFGISMAIYVVNRSLIPELPELRMTKHDVQRIVGVMALILVAIYLISVKSIV